MCVLRPIPLLLLCWLGVCSAADLNSVYQLAMSNDADFAAAAADRDAGQEEAIKGRAGLLPSVMINGSQSHNNTEQRGLTVSGMRSTQSDYKSGSYGIQLRQPLYRPYQWAGYLQGQARTSYSEAVFSGTRQDLLLRTAGSYFDVLLAKDNLDLAQAQRQAYAEQLSQAKRLLLVGEGTLTDVNDAQAKYDGSLAQELEATSNLEIAKRSMERIIGRPAPELSPLAANKPDPLSPNPNKLDQWVEWTILGNPAIQAQRFAMDVARQEVAKAGSDHKPTLDLIASRTKSESENNVSINNRYDTRAIGVQLSIPLYSGGYASANVRQAEAGLRKAEQQLESATRKATLDARQQFLSVNTGVAQINAYQQAVASSEAALLSTRKGFQAGIRTSVDILNAQHQIYLAKRDLAKARYSYMMSWLKLKAAVGTLGEDDVQYVNGWLAGGAG